MAEEITSPPFPNMVSGGGLYDKLRELREWVEGYREALNDEAGQAVIPAVAEFPEKKMYVQYQPVPVQFYHWSHLRQIRREWDILLQNYEDAWNCKPCIRQRVMLVQQAALLLNGAFMDPETREAKQQAEQERMQRSFERLMAHYKNIMDPDDEEETQDRKKKRRG